MKKFLSLLLALTLVLSLVVVPARAADGDEATIAAASSSIVRGASTSVLVTAPTTEGHSIKLGSGSWRSNDTSIVTVVGNDSGATVTGVKAGTTKVVFSYTLVTTGDNSTTTEEAKTAEVSITVTDSIVPSDVASVTFNGRTYNNTNSGCTVYYLSSEISKLGTKDGNWSITSSTVTLTSVSYNEQSHKATLSLSKAQGEGQQPLTGSLEVTCTQATVPNDKITVRTTADSDGKYRAGTELTLSVHDSSNKNSQNVRYVWSATKDGTALPSVTVSSANKWTPSAAGKYILTRTVYEGTAEKANEVGTQTSNAIEVKEDNYKTTVTAPLTSLSVAANSTAIPYSFVFKDYRSSTAGVIVPLDSTSVTWSVSGGNAKFHNNSTT